MITYLSRVEAVGRGPHQRKLLKKYAMIPVRLVADDVPSYDAATRDLGVGDRHEQGKSNERRIRINPHADASSSCNVLRARGQHGDFYRCTSPSSIPSMSNAISLQHGPSEASRRGDENVARCSCCNMTGRVAKGTITSDICPP